MAALPCPPVPVGGFEAEQAARASACRWVYRVGFAGFDCGQGKGKAAAVAGAWARCRVVALVILGKPLLEACGAAGYQSVKGWIDSCKGAKFWDVLRAGREVSAHYEAATVAARRFEIEAEQAAKA